MKNYHHIVYNFPKGSSIIRKIFSNIIFLIAVTKTTIRKNLLDENDLQTAKNIIQAGDVLLVGQLQRVIKHFIRDPVTHSELAIGNNIQIHATADGVEKSTIEELVSTYDTLVILRPKISISKREYIISNAIKYAFSKKGKPFNFFLEEGTHHFYCTQLVNDAYTNAGFVTGIINSKKNKKPKFLFSKLSTPRPIQFINDNFKIIYLSKHLKMNKGGKLSFVKK